ncbi:hypothetical protein H0H92_001440, partial [Tricholoma furcatifolium]
LTDDESYQLVIAGLPTISIEILLRDAVPEDAEVMNVDNRVSPASSHLPPQPSSNSLTNSWYSTTSWTPPGQTGWYPGPQPPPGLVGPGTTSPPIIGLFGPRSPAPSRPHSPDPTSPYGRLSGPNTVTSSNPLSADPFQDQPVPVPGLVALIVTTFPRRIRPQVVSAVTPSLSEVIWPNDSYVLTSCFFRAVPGPALAALILTTFPRLIRPQVTSAVKTLLSRPKVSRILTTFVFTTFLTFGTLLLSYIR